MAELTKPIESFITLLLEVSGRARPIDLEAHVPVGAEEVLRAYVELHPELDLAFEEETLVLRPPAPAPEPQAPSPWLVPEPEPAPPAAGPFTPEPAPEVPEVDLSSIPLVDTVPSASIPPFTPAPPSPEVSAPQAGAPGTSEPPSPMVQEPARVTTDDSEFFEFGPSGSSAQDVSPPSGPAEPAGAPAHPQHDPGPVVPVPPLPEIPEPTAAEAPGSGSELIFVQQPSDEELLPRTSESPSSLPLPDLSGLPEIPEAPTPPGGIAPSAAPGLPEDADDIGL